MNQSNQQFADRLLNSIPSAIMAFLASIFGMAVTIALVAWVLNLDQVIVALGNAEVAKIEGQQSEALRYAKSANERTERMEKILLEVQANQTLYSEDIAVLKIDVFRLKEHACQSAKQMTPPVNLGWCDSIYNQLRQLQGAPRLSLSSNKRGTQ